MPYVIFGGVVLFALVFLKSKKTTNSTTPPGVPGNKQSGGLLTNGGKVTTEETKLSDTTIENTISHVLTPGVTQSASQVGKITGIGSLIDAGASIIGAGIHDKTASAIFTYGIAAAVAVAAINVWVGIAIAYVVVFVVLVVEQVDFYSDMAQRNMQKGIDQFWVDWANIHTHIIDLINNKAMAAGQTADPKQVELAATAFADGFMLRTNYLRAWYAYCGGMFHNDGQGGVQPWASIARAWFIGAYAGTAAPKFSKNVLLPFGGWIPVQPVINVYSSYPFTDVLGGGQLLIDMADNLPAKDIFSDGDHKSVLKGRFGMTVLDVSPPACKSDSLGDPISVAWRTMGNHAADASQFLQAVQSPQGTGQSGLSSIVWYRDRGLFQGACHGTPDVPSGLGYTLNDVSAYSPDLKTITFTAV